MTVKPNQAVNVYSKSSTVSENTTFTFTAPSNIAITGVQFKIDDYNVPASTTSSEPGSTFTVTFNEATGFNGFEVTYGYISGSCGSNATWSLAKQNGQYTALTISGSGDMSNYDHTTVDELWRTTAPWGYDLTSVTIGNNITKIGDYAFIGCQSLSSLTIGSGVTTIATNAFDHCDGLTTVTLPAGVSTLGSGAFRNCTGLKRVNIEKSNGLVTLGSNGFYGTALETIVVPTPALAVQYKSASNWSSHASKLRVPLGSYLFTATDEGGTAAYAITNDTDLRNLSTIVSGTKDIASGLTFRQTANITLSGNFTPIGNDHSFTGTYDGGNYTISGLIVNGAYKYTGLFGYLSSATVKNVHLISPSCTTTHNEGWVGALAGSSYNTHYENCWIYNPTIKAAHSDSYFAAIIGKSYFDLKPTNLYFYDNVHDYKTIESLTYIYEQEPSNICRARKVTVGSGLESVTPAAADMDYGFIYNNEKYYREGLQLTLNSNLSAPAGQHIVYKSNNNTSESNSFNVDGSDVTLTAELAYNPYTVQFNANAGTGTMDSQAFTYGTAQTLTANAFTRAGYTFAGWATTANGEVVYTDQQSVNNLTPTNGGTVTLYAKWNTITYDITYNLAGGTVATANPITYNVETATFTLNNPTRTGYTFAGWTGSNGDTPQTEVVITQGNINALHYEAHWTAHHYAIHFDGNGHTGGTMSDQTFTYDKAQKLTANAFTRAGYTFAGWATTADGEVAYTDQQSIINLTATNDSTLTFYANWSVNTYQIIYNLNGGTLTTENNSFTVESDDITLDEPTREHFIFGGWYESSNFSGTAVTTIGHGSWGEKTLYAKWLVPYIDANGDTQTCSDYTVLTSSTDISGLNHGWYVVDGSVEYSRFIWVNGDNGGAHLILCDGAHLSVSDSYWGIVINAGSLTIYAQSTGSNMGQLTATSGNRNCISSNVGDITICGGKITAEGGNSNGCAGIFAYNNVTIYSGQVNATGDKGIGSSNITLGLRNATDYINASSYDGTVKVADGQTLYDEAGNKYSGTLTEDQTSTLGGKKAGLGWAVTIDPETAHGTIVSNKAGVCAVADNKTVTLTPNPNTGYELKSNTLTVTKDSNQEVVALTDNGNGTWSFQMPAEAVTASAEMMPTTYTITYNLDGGTVATANPTSYNIETATFTLTNPTKPGYTFTGWTKGNDNTLLTTVTIEQGSTENRTYTAHFEVYLHDITIGGLTYRNTSATEATVTACNSSATTVTIPATVTDNNVTYNVTAIDANAFTGCTSLNTIIMEPTTPPALGTGAFNACTALAYIGVPAGTDATYKAAAGWSTYEDKIYAIDGTCGDNVYWVYNSDSKTLTIFGSGEIVIPTGGMRARGYESSRAQLTSSAPWKDYIESIQTIVIKSGVTSIGDYAFKNCTAVTSIDIPNSVTSIGEWALNGCSSLTSIDIPASVTSIGTGAFYSCSGLTSIVIPASVTSIGEVVFSNCSSLESISVAADNTTFDSRNNCNAIIKKATNTLIAGCKNTDIPDDVTSIDNYAFYGHTGLTEVTIPANVKTIGRATFSGCTGLTEVTIPAGVTSIDEYAFNECTNLTTVYIHRAASTITQLGKKAFDKCTALSTIYVPTNKVNDYKIATNWSEYAKKIKAVDGTCGDNVYWVYNSDSKTLTVFGEGTMTNDQPWSNYLSDITTVNIGDGVTSIGTNAFKGCTALTTVMVQRSKSPITQLGTGAFDECTALSTIYVPNDKVDSYTTATNWSAYASKIKGFGSYGYSMYWTYDSTSKTLTVFGEGAMTNDQPWSSYLSDITTVNIGDGVTSISTNAFKGCTALTTVYIKRAEWPITQLEEKAFDECTALTTIYVPTNRVNDYKTATNWSDYASKIQRIGFCGDNIYWVYNSDSKTLTIYGSGPMESFESSSSAPWYDFRNDITTITIKPGVTSIGSNAFYRCTSLTSIDIPASVTSIGSRAFFWCTSLTSITIPASVTTIGNEVFINCTSLTAFTVDNGNTAYASEDGVLFNKNKTTLLIYPIGNSRTTYTIPGSVTTIGYGAFGNCTGLTSVNISGSVTTIGDKAFDGCTGLTSITIPASVTTIGNNAFDYCTSLTAFTVDNGNTAFASEDGVLFNKAKTTLVQHPIGNSRTTYTIPGSVTTIGHGAFGNCTGLTSINISGSVTSIGDQAFTGCTGLTGIDIPTSVTTIGNSAFFGCTGLTSITIPNSVKSIGAFALYGCTNLVSATIPNDMTSIPDDIFEFCSSLTNFVIPAGVTTIGNFAFQGCSALTGITIPANVTEIGIYAFSGCTGLTTVFMQPTPPPTLDHNVFYNCDALDGIYVPAGTAGDYKAADNWSEYEGIIKEMSEITEIALADEASNNALIAGVNGLTLDVTLQDRTLYKDGDWNTICLPFDVTLAGSLLEGATVKKFNASTSGVQESTLILNFDDETTTLYAGVPYLIKWENGSNLVNPVFTGVTIKAASTEVTTTDGKVTFQGTYDRKVWNEEDKSVLFVGLNSTLYWPKANGHVNACRAYFQLNNGLTIGSGVTTARMNFEDETTSLSEKGIVNSEKFATATGWYDMSGRKLEEKPTKAGLYIHNGRKTVIK